MDTYEKNMGWIPSRWQLLGLGLRHFLLGWSCFLIWLILIMGCCGLLACLFLAKCCEFGFGRNSGKYRYFPTCQVRVVRFYKMLLLLLFLVLLFLLLLLLLLFIRVLSLLASSWSQWASPDLNSHCRIAVGIAGPQPAKSRLQWALPDLNRQHPIAVGIAGPEAQERMPENIR